MHSVRSSLNSVRSIMTRARSIMTRALVALFNSGRDDQLWEVGTHGQYVHTGHVNSVTGRRYHTGPDDPKGEYPDKVSGLLMLQCSWSALILTCLFPLSPHLEPNHKDMRAKFVLVFRGVGRDNRSR